MTKAFHHGDWTGCVCFVDGGKLLASSGEDGVIRCWTAKGTLRRAFEQPSYSSCCGAIEATLVAGFNGADGSITVWDAASGKRLHQLPGHPTARPKHRTGANTSAGAFTRDARILASGGFDDCVRLWEMKKGAEVGTLGVGDMVWSIALSADGSRLAAGLGDGSISLWNLESRRRIAAAKASRGAATSVAFISNEELVSGGGKGEVSRWRLDAKKLIKVKDYLRPDGGGVEGIAVSPDGKRLAAASRARWMRVWDVESGAELKSIVSDSEFYLDVDYSPDGKRIAVAGPSPVRFVSMGLSSHR